MPFSNIIYVFYTILIIYSMSFFTSYFYFLVLIVKQMETYAVHFSILCAEMSHIFVVSCTDPEGKYEALEKYGKDLTAMARAGKLDPVIGRDDEIRRCIQILSRRTKNNPVLIGEPGVGKTAVSEGYAIFLRLSSLLIFINCNLVTSTHLVVEKVTLGVITIVYGLTLVI